MERRKIDCLKNVKFGKSVEANKRKSNDNSIFDMIDHCSLDKPNFPMTTTCGVRSGLGGSEYKALACR